MQTVIAMRRQRRCGRSDRGCGEQDGATDEGRSGQGATCERCCLARILHEWCEMGSFSVRNSNQGGSHVWQRNSPVTGDRTVAEAEFVLHLMWRCTDENRIGFG